jgi:hypothetical protein
MNDHNPKAHAILYGPRHRGQLKPWERRCTRCKEVRHEDEFAWHDRGARRSSICKPCRNLEARLRHARKRSSEATQGGSTSGHT